MPFRYPWQDIVDLIRIAQIVIQTNHEMDTFASQFVNQLVGQG
jgi:hypothetical protein